jgi:Zn-dependent protease
MNDAATTWIDANQRAWTLRLRPGGVAIESDGDVIQVAASAYARDIYIAAHADRFIVRFATRDAEVGFIVDADAVRPFLEHLGAVEALQAQPQAQPESEADDPPRRRDVLWPKVSSVAVWALFVSSVSFVPIYGLIPGAVAVWLLVMHGRRVGPSRANAHSRYVCRAAIGFLLLGATTQMFYTLGQRELHQRIDNDTAPAPIASMDPAVEAPRGAAPRSAASIPSTTPLAEFSLADHNWGLVIATLFVVIMSLSVHECAHAISAWWLGDDFARRLGRVTLNPASHIDPFGTIVLPMILFLTGSGVFGWARPVPVQIAQCPNPRRANILISAAGPASNLLLAAACLALLIIIGNAVPLFFANAKLTMFSDSNFTVAITGEGFPLANVVAGVCNILKVGYIANLLLACFNLIPIPPLDGSWILENRFPLTLGPIYEKIRPYGFLIFLCLIMADAFMYLLYPAFVVLFLGLGMLAGATPLV